jgi:Tol biopolymer transport system component
VREGALLAQRFDAGKLQLAGEAFTVAERVGVDPRYHARFSLSQTGVLMYGSDGSETRRLQWFDRSGRALDSVGPAGQYTNVDLSPEGRRVAVDRLDPQTRNGDIWLFDLARGASTRLTSHPALDVFPAWSPDGRRIAFGSGRDGAYNLYQKDASGAGEEEPLLKTPNNKYPTGWSHDGRWLLYREQDQKTRWDLWVVPLDPRQPSPQPRPWLRTEFDENDGRFSPDGQWVAYDSNESGRYEIYVRRFSPGEVSGTGKWPVSTGGASSRAGGATARSCSTWGRTAG